MSIRGTNRLTGQAQNTDAPARASDLGAASATGAPVFAQALRAKAQTDDGLPQGGTGSDGRGLVPPNLSVGDKFSVKAATAPSIAGVPPAAAPGAIAGTQPAVATAVIAGPANASAAGATALNAAVTTSINDGLPSVPAPSSAPAAAAPPGPEPDAKVSPEKQTDASDSTMTPLLDGAAASVSETAQPATGKDTAQTEVLTSTGLKRDDRKPTHLSATSLAAAASDFAALLVLQPGGTGDPRPVSDSPSASLSDFSVLAAPVRHEAPTDAPAPGSFPVLDATATLHPSGDAVVGSPPADSAGAALPGVAPSDLKDWLAQPIVHLVASSRREMAIQLRPPELGELTVRVAVNGRNVSAWFETPQPQVQQAIAQAIPQLNADLGNAGYSLTGAWVGADSASGGAPQPQPMLPRSESRSRGFTSPTSPIRRTGQGPPSGVNIYV